MHCYYNALSSSHRSCRVHFGRDDVARFVIFARISYSKSKEHAAARRSNRFDADIQTQR